MCRHTIASCFRLAFSVFGTHVCLVSAAVERLKPLFCIILYIISMRPLTDDETKIMFEKLSK